MSVATTSAASMGNAGSAAAFDDMTVGTTPAARHLLPDSTDIMRVIQGGTFYRPSTGELFVTTYEDRATGRIHRYTIPAASGPVASDCIPGVESLVSDDSATAACVALPDGTGRRTVIEQWTRTGDVPATNGGAACAPVASPRTRSELCTPSPVPPPVDACVAAPVVVLVSSWPGSAEGARSGSWSWSVAGAVSTLAEARWTFTGGRSSRLTVTDSRGCAGSAVR